MTQWILESGRMAAQPSLWRESPDREKLLAMIDEAKLVGHRGGQGLELGVGKKLRNGFRRLR